MSRHSLSRLSNELLVAHLDRLVGNERAQLVDILRHLNEVERRKLHLAAGCSSLFDYCVSRLKYSQSAAGRRIAAARTLRRYPQIGPMLESGELNLVTLSMVASVLTPATKDAWLARIRGRSQRDVQRMVEETRPETATRDRVRPVCVRERVADPTMAMPITPAGGSESRVAAGRSTADGTKEELPDGETGCAGRPQEKTPKATANATKTCLVHKHKIQFVAGDAFMEKLEAIWGLLARRMPGASLEQVFDIAMEAYLEAKCPSRRNQRRQEKKEKKTTATTRSTRPRAGGTGNCRYVPTAVRDAVFARDGGQCTYVGPTGRRCGSRRNLELDHIQPFALGGGHTVTNLRLLCRAHNMLAAERTYGHDKMTAFAARE